MIRRLRRRHLRAVLALAVVIPLLLVLGWMGRQRPAPEPLPAELVGR